LKGGPQILDLLFKIAPISDHVVKFRGGRPRDRGDLALKKKKTAAKHKGRVCAVAYLGFQKGGSIPFHLPPSSPLSSLSLPSPLFPSLPLEVGPPPFPLLSPAFPFPSPPLRSRPLIAAKRSGGAL